MSGPDPAEYESLDSILARAEACGFAEHLVPIEGGELRIPSTGERVDARRAIVHRYWRLEGASDPADESFVAAVELPGEVRGRGVKGTVVLGYGTNATPADGDVLTRLELQA